MDAISITRLLTSRRALPLLQNALPSFSGDLLRGVVLALSTMRCDEAQATLFALADHPQEEVRLALIEALETKDAVTVRPLLTRLQREDTSARVRQAARSYSAP